MFDFLKQKKRIYLDYAAATPILREALQAVVETSVLVGNPSAIHSDGVEVRRVLEDARAKIARELACKRREIVFTSGGTEANNLAILGFAHHIQEATPLGYGGLSGTHWVVSAIEHPSVLECFAEIELLGGAVTFVDPDSRGIITEDAVARSLLRNTVFVSVGWANSEIGTVQPIAKIAHAIHSSNSKIIFHCDAGQAPLYLSPQVHTLGVDLFTLDSGKLYGPRGVGALFVRQSVALKSILHGGGQEMGLRPGSENVALAVGFAKAFEYVSRERINEAKRLKKLRDDFALHLVNHIHNIVINGDLKHALPHILNISIHDIDSSEYIALALDHRGISVSTKSACKEGEVRSYVVEALGGEEWRANNTLRFSFGRDTNVKDIECALVVLAEILSSQKRVI